jgi:UDP-glucose 4-epimerase
LSPRDLIRATVRRSARRATAWARPGDPARIVADGQLAARDLDWRMRFSLEEMVASAWSARKNAG